MKFPLRTLDCEPLSIRTPFWPLPDIWLPKGGTTNTGVVLPSVPVGLLACPVLVSTKAVPPIWLPLDPAVIHSPLPPFPIPTVPVGSVPMRLLTSVLPEEPCRLMPLPAFAEMTLAVTPEAALGFSPITLLADPGPT